MTPAEHYAEAERLLEAGTLPPHERDYTAESIEVLLAGIGHALLAQVRPDDPTGCLWERPADGTEPVPDGCEGIRAGGRWPQDHAQDVTVVAEVPPDPGTDVTEVVDRDNDLWRRSGLVHWECRTTDVSLRTWDELYRHFGPLRAVSPR